MNFDSSGQINPIAETSDKQLVAADAKLNFDDNAAFRQKEIFTLRDPSQEDPREVFVFSYNTYLSGMIFLNLFLVGGVKANHLG